MGQGDRMSESSMKSLEYKINNMDTKLESIKVSIDNLSSILNNFVDEFNETQIKADKMAEKLFSGSGILDGLQDPSTLSTSSVMSDTSDALSDIRSFSDSIKSLKERIGNISESIE